MANIGDIRHSEQRTIPLGQGVPAKAYVIDGTIDTSNKEKGQLHYDL